MLQNHIEIFVHWLRFEKRYSEHTVRSYHDDLLQFETYLKEYFNLLTDVSDIEHHQIRSWIALQKENGATATTLNRKISTLRSFFKQLYKQEIVQKNPMTKVVALKQAERLPIFVKEAQTTTLFEEVAFGDGFQAMTDRLICELLYDYGLRRSELIGLKERDVEWGLGQLRILGKGNKERLIPFSEKTAIDIQHYIAEKHLLETTDTEYLLVLPSGKPLYAGYVYRTVTKYLHQVTTLKKCSPHVLRHTFATHLLNNGANIQAIKELLGHSSLAATQIYAHNSIERLKDVHKQNHPRERKK